MRVGAFILTISLWASAFVGGQLLPVLGPVMGVWSVAPLAFAATLLLPGYLLDRLAGGAIDDRAHPLETAARSFAASLGIIAVLGLVAHVTRGSLNLVMAELFAVTMLLALIGPLGERSKRVGRNAWPTTSTALILVVLIVVCLMAAGGENIARDRMWYLAYAARLPLNDTLSWSEPFFGQAVWTHRFIANGWILSLSVWTQLGSLPAPMVFERVAPVFLSALLVAAHLSLSRALFGCGSRAIVGLLCSLAVFFATAFPFLSPTHYAFFDRIAEDKFVALMVLLPVLLTTLLDYLGRDGPGRLRILPVLGATAAGLALAHGLVYLIALVSFTALAVWGLLNRSRAPLARVTLAAFVLILAAAPPAWFGQKAVNQQLKASAQDNIYNLDTTHPVVRSHVRMDRLVEFEPGGPLANPGLIADPLLLLALLGLVPCLTRRKEMWSAFLVATTASGLALAYCPYISPLFGSYVLPWMAYRGLWTIPFGALLAATVLEGSRIIAPFGGATRGPTLLALLLIVGLSVGQLPLDRLHPRTWWRVNTTFRFDDDTRDLLDEVRKLPAWSVIATGNGLSELIPAHTGRQVVAFSDRGTVVFAGSRPAGERRLRALAGIIGLRGGSLRLRNQLAARFEVTHLIYEGGKCDRKAVELYRNERYLLCAEPVHRSRVSRLQRSRAVAGRETAGTVVASLDRGLTCEPPATSAAGTRSWRRKSRWSAANVTVDCEAVFENPVSKMRLRLELTLPHAHEAVVYRVRTRTSGGVSLKRQGAIEFKANPYGEITLPGHWIEKVNLRLAPAYLPYLNIKALELLGDQTAAG